MKILALVYIFFWLGSRIIIPKDREPHFYLIDCKIFDESSNFISAYPGFICAFADDGEWLSLEEDKMRIFDSTNQLRYTLPYKVHHELRFSRDQKRIYFLSSDFRTYKGVRTRFDVLNIADRKGNLLYSWNTADHIDELVQELNLGNLVQFLPASMKHVPKRDADYEFSHFNAIAEIPPNEAELFLPYMKRGNLIATFNGIGKIVVFDPKLSKIVHVFGDFVKLNAYGFHDAQILPNGHLIFFNNINEPGADSHTSIDEYDVLLKTRVWSFDFERPLFDLNKINGSVQVLSNGHILIGDNSFGAGRAVEITRKGEVVFVLMNNHLDPSTKLPYMIYRAKKISAEKFFKNNITGAMLK